MDKRVASLRTGSGGGATDRVMYSFGIFDSLIWMTFAMSSHSAGKYVYIVGALSSILLCVCLLVFDSCMIPTPTQICN